MSRWIWLICGLCGSAGAAETSASGSSGVPVLGVGVTVDSVELVENLTISDVRCRVDVSHSFVGDLTVALTSPSGTEVTLCDRSGGVESDLLVTFGSDGVPFDPNFLAAGEAWVMDVEPPHDFAAFDGESTLGTWTLSVTDHSPFDDGVLNGWTLTASDTPFGSSPPPNDLCIDAIRILETSEVPFDTSLASPSGFDPICGPTSSGDLWFLIEGTCDATYTASTCGSGESFIVVWNGTAACPTLALTPLACETTGCVDGANVTWSSTAAQDVYLQIGGVNGPIAGTLTLSSTAPPENDRCVDARILPTSGLWSDTTCASAEGSGAPCPGPSETPDGWFTVTPDRDGIVNLSTATSDFDPALALWDSCPSTGGTLVDCDPAPGSDPGLTWFAAAGTTWWIQVSGNRPLATGSTFLSWNLTPTPTGEFLRGDANGDASVNLPDAVYLLATLFAGGPSPDCLDAGDSNDDGENNVADAVFLLSALFEPGAAPLPAPGSTDCGDDPTPDPVDCATGACP